MGKWGLGSGIRGQGTEWTDLGFILGSEMMGSEMRLDEVGEDKRRTKDDPEVWGP